MIYPTRQSDIVLSGSNNGQATTARTKSSRIWVTPEETATVIVTTEKLLWHCGPKSVSRCTFRQATRCFALSVLRLWRKPRHTQRTLNWKTSEDYFFTKIVWSVLLKPEVVGPILTRYRYEYDGQKYSSCIWALTIRISLHLKYINMYFSRLVSIIQLLCLVWD